VLLQPGENRVEFRFFNGWGSRCLYVLAIGSLGLVCYSLIDLLRRDGQQLPGAS
jgi:hypothetical protein